MEARAEGFGSWEEHSPVADGVAFYEIEISVRVRLVVVVETVGAYGFDDWRVFCLALGDVVEIYACRVALVFDVEAELCLLYVLREIIDVLHHQPPVSLSRRVGGVLQRFHVECLRVVLYVACKLSDLVCPPAVGVFVSHGEHLVRLQVCAQRDVSQRLVDSVFA